MRPATSGKDVRGHWDGLPNDPLNQKGTDIREDTIFTGYGDAFAQSPLLSLPPLFLLGTRNSSLGSHIPIEINFNKA
jgi:hypothetical protein